MNIMVSENLVQDKSPALECESFNDCDKVVREYYQSVVEYYEKAHGWYRNRKDSQSRKSKFVKFFSIWFGVLGGLMPFLISNDTSVNLSCCFPSWLAFVRHPEYLGHIFLALSGSIVLFDKMFGFSTNWMRCIDAMRNLENTAARFEQQWILKRYELTCKLSETPAPDMAKLSLLYEGLFTVATDYKMAILDCVDKETQAWLAEFRTNLARLENSKTSGQNTGQNTVQSPVQADKS